MGVVNKINEYLTCGGLFNPELMEHEKVKDLILECKDEITRLNTIVERGDDIANNWENNCYQEAVHYNWLDDQNTKLQDLLNETYSLLQLIDSRKCPSDINEKNFKMLQKLKDSGYVYYFGK